MDKVSLLLTLYSIVAGLGISRLVQGVTAMIQARSNLRFYWMHTAWIVIIFLANILSWFALLRFATGAHWTVFNAMLTLFMPIVLYVVSDLVVPPIDGERRTDLREYFFHNCRSSFGKSFSALSRMICRPIWRACSSRSSPLSTFSARASETHCRVQTVAA